MHTVHGLFDLFEIFTGIFSFLFLISSLSHHDQIYCRISQPSHGVPGRIIRAEQAIHARPAVIEQLQAPRLISTSSHPPENTSDPPLHLVLTFASLSPPFPPLHLLTSNLPDLSVCPPFPFAAGAFEDTSASSEVLSHP
ncbi:hypothetical protein CBS115989_4130 [Aspergillus niger]|nr:hypothetical protein CBS133816_10122 [Aspergillus niger]KAI2819772.1 hypothetical protein CBS115989_4130 [Aspergillus niger]KAI2841698.1 hypothetical protein CBS11350_6243 [Aspergillus niger]KAI2849012.1 hypothetical protein CBS11232_6703 [Aspergillus niger]KAI2863939.1 hypothetical protein CBS12448_3459 [Aspergillus niger]